MNPALLDLPALRAFVAVAREGSVSRAAAPYRTTNASTETVMRVQSDASVR